MPNVRFQGDLIQFPDGMSGDEVSDVLGALWASTQAVSEFAATLGTGAVAEIAGGLSGLGIAAGLGEGRGAESGAGARTAESVIQGLTYQPRTRAGQLAMQSIANDVRHLAQVTGAEHLSGYWKDRVVPALQENFGVISGSVLAAVGLGLIGAFAEMSPGKILPVRGMRGAVGDVGTGKNVFHGSTKRIDKFKRGTTTTGRLGKGIYFTGNEKRANMFASLRKRQGGESFVNKAEIFSDNPAIMTEDRLLQFPQGEFPAEAFEAQGFTGIQLVDKNGSIIEETVFDPANVRSLNKPEGIDIPSLKSSIDVEQGIFDTELVELRRQLKESPERKDDLMVTVREKRSKLDNLKQQLSRAESAANPTPKRAAPEPAPIAPSKSFKGKVFHQTGSDFSEFDFDQGADGTIWFTDKLSNFNDPSSSSGAASGTSRVIESDIVLNKVAGFKDLDKFSIGELIQQGFDGAVFGGDIQVFDPKAIKTVK